MIYMVFAYGTLYGKRNTLKHTTIKTVTKYTRKIVNTEEFDTPNTYVIIKVDLTCPPELVLYRF